ncbi:MAG: hypothetical protein LQ352_004355, partial [Teloschistes flavicans]
MQFTQSPLYPISYFFFQEAIVIVTIAFTPANSLLRLALLPLLVILGNPVILSCPTTLYRSGWAGFIGGFIIASLFYYVEIALLSQWDFKSQGPTSVPSHGDYPSPTRPRPRPPEDTIVERLKFGHAVVTNSRKVGTPWQVKNTPAYSRDPSYIPTRTSFILYRILTTTATILVIDLLSQVDSTPEKNSYRFSEDKVYIFTGNASNLEPSQILNRLVIVLIYWLCTGILIDAFFNIRPTISVLLHIKSVQDYRPNFGSITEAYTIRQFWSVFWHQHIRKQFSAPADLLVYRVLRLRQHSLSARYTHLFTVFLLSGLFHTWLEKSQGFSWNDSGQLHFFLTQAGGIVAEDAVQSVWRHMVGEERQS